MAGSLAESVLAKIWQLRLAFAYLIPLISPFALTLIRKAAGDAGRPGSVEMSPASA